MELDSSADSYVFINKEDEQECEVYIEQHGLSKIEDFFRAKLDQWKDVRINIGVTGNSGVGKSSFINAIRGLADDNELAAKTGVSETTKEATPYPHPTNQMIKFWDLPGIGTPNYPDLPTYCNKVNLGKFDAFLILTAARFTQNDHILVKEVKSMKKSFFFIRTKIDDDCRNEGRKKSFNEEALLNSIKKDCLENLKGLKDNDEEVFLISNHHPEKWEFARLEQAILDGLPYPQMECLTLSLHLLTSHSTALLKRKAKVLRRRIWKVATMSATCGIIPLPGFSAAVDFVLLMNETRLYKSQLGLPEEESDVFKGLSTEKQERVRTFCIKSAAHLATLCTTYAAGSAVEELARYIPIIGSAIAGTLSFSFTYKFLQDYLNKLEKTAQEFLVEKKQALMNDLDID